MNRDTLTWARLKAEAWEQARHEQRYSDADTIRASLREAGYSIKSKGPVTILKDPAGIIRMAG